MENTTKKNIKKIGIVGVGGGGNNAVIRMIHKNIKNVEFVIMNTECSSFNRVQNFPVTTLQIGKETTKGLGCGANEVIGEQCALENKEEIKNILSNMDMVFLTSGMGGGTGTGAIPIVAEIAQELGILTIGIVTKPFTFEGKQRQLRAERGIIKLRKNVDALIVVLNDNLLKVLGDKTTINEAFSVADDVLRQGIQSITDLLTTVGQINVDFADIKTIMSYKGICYMGIGQASGEDRLLKATKEAIGNPLTETKINNAKGIIFNVYGSENLGLSEINNSIKLINDVVDTEVNVIFGTVIDDTLEDTVKVTVIATGIDN